MVSTIHLTPVRMCIVCRQRRPKLELIRWFEQSGNWQVDPSSRGGKRGRYSCPGNCQQRLEAGT